MPGSSPGMTIIYRSRTPRRAPARIALHTSPIPRQREISALRAHLAFVAFGFRLGAAFGLARSDGGSRTRLAPLHGLELFGRGEVVADFLLERHGAFDRVGGAAGLGAVRGQRRDLAAA